MSVVSTETCPSQARTVLMSTPARRRWVAVVWRMVWGLIRLASDRNYLCIDVGGVNRNMPEPGPNRVDVYAGTEKVGGGRVANGVGADPFSFHGDRERAV